MMILRISVLILILLSNFTVHAFFSLSSGRSTCLNGRSTLQMISHGKGFNKLGLPADQRKALLRGLTTQVIRHGRIRTTLARAKAVRKPVDHMITLAKKGTKHCYHQCRAYIYDQELIDALFDQATERYGDRNGGYCRVIRDPVRRRGDFAQMAFVELV